MLGGAVVAGDTSVAEQMMQQVRVVQNFVGGVAAPFDCWLALRGMRSLGARMRLHCSNASQVAEFLSKHPAVEAVHYPGRSCHPGHQTMAAQCQGRGFGGMLSFQLQGGRQAAISTAARMRLIRRATSLGGTETLVEHRRSIEPADSPTPENLLRLSVGLEDLEDILQDLEQALSVQE